MSKKKQPRPISEIKFEMLMLDRMMDEYAAIAPENDVRDFRDGLDSERHMFKNLPQTRLIRRVLKRRLMDALNTEKAYWTNADRSFYNSNERVRG
jgi:hypothetical protein